MLHHACRNALLKRLIAFAASASLLSACATGPTSTPSIPRVVEDVRRGYVQDCAPDPAHLGKNVIQSADINGDGAADYVVSAFDYVCRGDTPYCGSAGCEVEIFLSGPGGLLEQRFSGYLREPPRFRKKAGKRLLVSGGGREEVIFDPRAATFSSARRD